MEHGGGTRAGGCRAARWWRSWRQDRFGRGRADAQKAVAARTEAEAFSAVPYVPLGQYQIPTALRQNLTGLHRASAPFVWGLRKT